MKLISLILILFHSILHSQIVEGVDFAKYPAIEKQITKKTKLKINTSPYKDRVKEIQEKYNGTTTFAGNYATVLWICGEDCARGVMIDNRTGYIYKLPISSENTSNRCTQYDNIFDRYLFLPNSKLFVTSTCKSEINKGETYIRQSFFFYLWSEKEKKFTLLKRTSKLSNLKELNQ